MLVDCEPTDPDRRVLGNTLRLAPSASSWLTSRRTGP